MPHSPPSLHLCLLLAGASAVPVELKDDGDGLTGPQPSIVGSLDKVFNNVKEFDGQKCLQKMICEAMGTAEDLVVAGVNSQLGQQGGQLAQTGFNQFQANPNQFVQSQFNGGSPLVAAATAQLPQQNQQFLQSGQAVLQSGQQLFNTGQQFLQQFPQQQQAGQFQTSFRPQNQFQQQNQFHQQNQFQQTQFLPQNQVNRFSQNGQFGQVVQGVNQFGRPVQQFSQNQFGQNQFSQNQFGQNQFSQNQFGQNQFAQNQFGQGQGQSSGGLVDSLVDGLAGMLASVPVPGPLGRRRRRDTTIRRSRDTTIRRRRDTTMRRRRDTTMHGNAIRLMQNLGLQNMGAYPFVRAAIIGHANRNNPRMCQDLAPSCPSGSSQLLSYFNNHNGGLGQSVVPGITNEVGSLFPGLASLPQVAASTFGDFASSSSGSGQGGEGGLVSGLMDTIAGFIAGATLPSTNGKGAK